MHETNESRLSISAAATDLVAIAIDVAELMETAARGKMTPDTASVRRLAASMHEAVDRVEAQLLARIPSVRP